MFLCVGLGNPGIEYAQTRHNMGWMALDAVLERMTSLKGPSMKFSGALWDGFLNGERLLCLKPMTYMNLSGKAVWEAAEYFRIEHSRILVLYDDRALPLGALRMRSKGSAGGHNGIASVIASLGSLEIPRLRIGVGPLPEKIPLRRFVTSPFSREEQKELPHILEGAARGVSLWITEGIQNAMNAIN